MKRRLILTVLTIAALTSVASADRGHHRGGWGRGHGGGGHWQVNAGVVVQPRVIVQPRVVMQPRVRVVRRPIFVRAPELRVHYYSYEQRPRVLAENYPAQDGYYWVNGQWTWTGYEWSWRAGHYEPVQQPEYYDQGYYDQSYDQSTYSPSYDQSAYVQGSYEAGWSQPPCND